MTCRTFVFLAISMCLLVASMSVRGQSAVLYSDQDQMKKILNEYHFLPRVVDEKFSKDVFTHVLKLLDPDKLYFTASDSVAMEKASDLINTDWTNGQHNFVNVVTGILERSLVKAGADLKGAGRERIQWQVSDKLLRKGKLHYAENDLALKERWKQWIKFKVLEETGMSAPLDSPKIRVTITDVLTHESDNKQRAVEAEARTIQQLSAFQGGLTGKVSNVFLKSIAAAFDPHSLYLSPLESENFVGAITSQSYSFGLELKEEENGDLSIERLVPGGPGWKSGMLHKGDILFTLKPENKSIVNLEGIGLDSLSELLDQYNHVAIELTIRTESGERKTAKLQKEKMEDSGNIVKGAVIHARNKVGYISLPGFYSEWGSDQGSSCANDMARQILKMKKENINGLIVDIRSNGGGSVLEAIELAGIFIDQGPLAVFKNGKGVITTLKDVNRGTIYDGPLVVLVDGRSASASELLAAALQDYHRAIIAGSPTFGKATSQRIFSLDPKNQKPDLDVSHSSQNGVATVTIEKIYRPTGKTVQGFGVQPDILIPGLYDGVMPHEANLPRALARDSISIKVPIKPLPALPIAMLREKSEVRLNQNSWFAVIARLNKTILTEIEKENRFISLDWNEFLNSPLINASDIPKHPASGITSISVPEFDQAQMQRNPFEKENNDRWIRTLMDDEYVIEAYFLLDDYISILNSRK